MLNSLILLNVSVVNLLRIHCKRWADWVCPCVPVCLFVNKQEFDTWHIVNKRHRSLGITSDSVHTRRKRTRKRKIISFSLKMNTSLVISVSLMKCWIVFIFKGNPVSFRFRVDRIFRRRFYCTKDNTYVTPVTNAFNGFLVVHVIVHV